MAQVSDPTVPGTGNLPGSGSPSGGPNPTGAPPTAEQIRESVQNKYVCPFCGSINETEQGVCPRCTMENTAASRKATKVRIGPWYVLQTRNPAAPGMKFETLLSFVKKGRVKPHSVVRGPTTHQLWRFAAQVKGLSREFGVCYTCGAAISTTASLCPQCNRLQDPPPNPDVLLESSKDAAASPAAAPAAPPAPATPKFQEPSLEQVDADFVVPAIGTGGLTDSMAGFSLNDSLAGMVINQPWARIESAARSAAAARPGAARPAAGHPAPPAPTPAAPPSAPAAAPRDPRSPHDSGEFRDPFGPRARRDPAGRPGAQPAGPQGYVPPRPADRPGTVPNGKKRDPEGFLSARDLAAAFKLELAGESDAPPPAQGQAFGPPGGRPQPVPEALYQVPRPRRRKQRGVFRTLLNLLLLAALGYGVAIYANEDFRRWSFDWVARMKASLFPGDAAPGPQAPNPPNGQATPAAPAAIAPLVPAGTPLTRPTSRPAGTGAASGIGSTGEIGRNGEAASPSPEQILPSPELTGQDPFGPPPVSNGTAGPNGAPGVTGEAGRKDAWSALIEKPEKAEKPERPRPAVTESKPVTPAPAPAPMPAPPPPPAAAPANPDPLAAQTAALRVYKEAIEAQSRGDWAGAVAKYKAVKTYPPETWPTDLNTRLKVAESQLRGRR